MVGREEREPRYAWVVVAVLFLANAVASGTQGSFGLLVRPWETDFGWERAAISLTASIGFVVYGTSQALSGRWADRVGPRTIWRSFHSSRSRHPPEARLPPTRGRLFSHPSRRVPPRPAALLVES